MKTAECNSPEGSPANFNPTLMCALERATQSILDDHIGDTPYNRACVRNFLVNMETVIRNQESPERLFEFLGKGVFKECYESGIPGWIVKFYDTKNETSSERQILECAEEHGLQDIFIPTYFVDFPFTIDSDHIYDDDELVYNEHYDTYVLNDEPGVRQLCGCQLQPKVIPQNQLSSKSYINSCYREEPVLHPNTSQPIPQGIIESFYIDSLTWIRELFALHGYDTAMTLHRFIRDFNIDDLHNANIGYLVKDDLKYPVILDWLSPNLSPGGLWRT
jgi:hypothetical protein